MAQRIGDGGDLVVRRLVGERRRDSLGRRGEIGYREAVALGIVGVSSHRAMLYSVRREKKEGATR
jgi:hypothetical protein